MIGINYNTYIVQSGDTLFSIANKYNTSVSKLKELNGLTSNIIKVNQKIKIPNNYYIVKKGDSLWKIAKDNNTTINDLIKLNNLNSTTIVVGQKLLLK